MAIYRYCFRDAADTIRETQERNFAHDKQAIDNSAAFTTGRADHRMEIWQGARLVQAFGLAPAADPRPARR